MFPRIITGHFLLNLNNAQSVQHQQENLNDSHDLGEEIRAQYLSADPSAITKVERKNSYINELFQDENQQAPINSMIVGEIVKQGAVKELESNNQNSIYNDMLMNDKKASKNSALKHIDQKLPKAVTNQPSTYCYVNKNGYAQVLQTEYITDKNFDQKNINRKASLCSEKNCHYVPNTNSSFSSNADNSSVNTISNSSLVQANPNGQVQIHTNLMLQEESIDIKSEHIKYLSFVVFLFCWCFPLTGIPAVIYSRLTRKYFRQNDLARAKEYLTKTEKFIMFTFFFGFTLVAIIFAVLQSYLFNIHASPIVNATKESAYRPFVPH